MLPTCCLKFSRKQQGGNKETPYGQVSQFMCTTAEPPVSTDAHAHNVVFGSSLALLQLPRLAAILLVELSQPREAVLNSEATHR